jgi:hypothetical protein
MLYEASLHRLVGLPSDTKSLPMKFKATKRDQPQTLRWDVCYRGGG